MGQCKSPGRDASQLSATETREQALSDADHLGVLHAIWTEHCRAAAHDRYASAVRESASPADAEQILSDTSAVWRTVRAAELAGLDGAASASTLQRPSRCGLPRPSDRYPATRRAGPAGKPEPGRSEPPARSRLRPPWPGRAGQGDTRRGAGHPGRMGSHDRTDTAARPRRRPGT